MNTDDVRALYFARFVWLVAYGMTKARMICKLYTTKNRCSITAGESLDEILLLLCNYFLKLSHVEDEVQCSNGKYLCASI
jgi:hypothetical protein